MPDEMGAERPQGASQSPTIAVPPAMLAERKRQVEVKGYDAHHDDEHDGGELLAAAAVYCLFVTSPDELDWHDVLVANRPHPVWPRRVVPVTKEVPVDWPWEASWWKPKTPARDLERAGALCLAEIERLKRAGQPVAEADALLAQVISAYREVSP